MESDVLYIRVIAISYIMILTTAYYVYLIHTWLLSTRCLCQLFMSHCYLHSLQASYIYYIEWRSYIVFNVFYVTLS
jgi:hypothetical protein